MTRNKNKIKKSYKRLLIWQKTNELVLRIYQETKSFPRNEQYGITSQIRRAALSVTLNIIEGHARRTSGDFRRFLDISLGSLAETEYLLELCVQLEYMSKNSFDEIEAIRAECGRILWSYRSKIQ